MKTKAAAEPMKGKAMKVKGEDKVTTTEEVSPRSLTKEKMSTTRSLLCHRTSTMRRGSRQGRGCEFGHEHVAE